VEPELGPEGQDRAEKAASGVTAGGSARRPLYTPEERARRDSSRWTLVQGILAPVQFVIFGISLYLVLDYLRTGENKDWAIWSVVIKTMALYAIMVTGAIWEKVVFGKYLFAESFYWEDVFSMLVIALHTAYLVALFWKMLSTEQLMWLALAAYFTYVINAGQFIWKLRLARLESAGQPAHSPAKSGADNEGALAA
jgi:3-vinyl bacteriochlorophyllide hydratase